MRKYRAIEEERAGNRMLSKGETDAFATRRRIKRSQSVRAMTIRNAAGRKRKNQKKKDGTPCAVRGAWCEE